MSQPADSPSQAYLKALMVPAMAMANAALSRVIYRTILDNTPIAHDAGCPVPVTLRSFGQEKSTLLTTVDKNGINTAKARKALSRSHL